LRCFRDEDQRGDRQPEFTQLDLEMSFVEREDVMKLTEDMFTQLVKEILPNKRLLASPWPRLTYIEALSRFGKDNPDLRYGLELKDITDLAAGSGFQVFERVITEGGCVRGINASSLGEYSRKQIDELTEYVARFGAKGLAYLAIQAEGEYRSSFAKFLSEKTLKEILSRLDANPGDLLLFVADKSEVVFESLARLRVFLAERMKLADENVLAFCWVIDFPFVIWNKEENRWDPSHHLFTSPIPDDIPLLDRDPSKALGQQYDLVLNNFECGADLSGFLIVNPREGFRFDRLDPDVARQRFGHCLRHSSTASPTEAYRARYRSLMHDICW
jgi:aspartyl-tRNA synthetase